MRTTFRVLGVAFILLILFGGLLTARAQDKIYTRQGILTAVDYQHDTIVVEVPVNGREMTVAGPLALGASVVKEGHTAGLADLEVGATVTVKWERTPEGHSILEVRQR